MSGLSNNSAFDAFARMEEKITTNERQLQAAQEIDEEFSGDRLAGEFKQLESATGGASADMQLQLLKQRMGALSAGAPTSARQLAAGAPEAAKPAEPAAQLTAGKTEDKKTGEAELIAEIEQLRDINPRSEQRVGCGLRRSVGIVPMLRRIPLRARGFRGEVLGCRW